MLDRCRTSLPPSDQAEALVLLHGPREAAEQCLFGLVAGHVEQVVAGVGHRQVVLLSRGGLDDDAQALHAVDGDPVAAGQEHCGRDTQRQSQQPDTAFMRYSYVFVTQPRLIYTL